MFWLETTFFCCCPQTLYTKSQVLALFHSPTKNFTVMKINQMLHTRTFSRHFFYADFKNVILLPGKGQVNLFLFIFFVLFNFDNFVLTISQILNQMRNQGRSEMMNLNKTVQRKTVISMFLISDLPVTMHFPNFFAFYCL